MFISNLISILLWYLAWIHLTFIFLYANWLHLCFQRSRMPIIYDHLPIFIEFLHALTLQISLSFIFFVFSKFFNILQNFLVSVCQAVILINVMCLQAHQVFEINAVAVDWVLSLNNTFDLSLNVHYGFSHRINLLNECL